MNLKVGKYYLYKDREGIEVYKVISYVEEINQVETLTVVNTFPEDSVETISFICSGSGYDKLSVEISYETATLYKVVYGP
jgi:hypothetical protein